MHSYRIKSQGSDVNRPSEAALKGHPPKSSSEITSDATAAITAEAKSKTVFETAVSPTPRAPHSISESSQPIVNIKAVAKHFGCDKRTIRKMVRDGRIPCYAIHNGARTYLKFRIAEVEAALRRTA